MSIHAVPSFAAGAWVPPAAGARPIESAITGAVIAEAGNDALDVEAMLEYARSVGGPALRKLTFHDRARMLKALALYLREHRQRLYDLSFDTGATQKDNLIDIDGGIGIGAGCCFLLRRFYALFLFCVGCDFEAA